MSSYKSFAAFYDSLTYNVNYEAACGYITSFLNKGEGLKLLDLACGTGSMTKLMCDAGYDVTGVDLSEDMLLVASSKCSASFIKADMRSFDFKERFDNCICCLDSINHLNSLEDWKSCFESVYKSLKTGGVFVFDVNTVYKHNSVLADRTFVFDEEDYYLVWDNEDEGDNKIRIMLDFFVFNGVNYDRFSEEFYESAFALDEIKSALSPCFEVLGIYDNITQNPPENDSERVFFICKKVR